MNRLAWLGLGVLLVTTPSWADWELAADSRVQFVSIKQNTVGEISHFERISGAVSQDGQVDIRVSLDSVETMIVCGHHRQVWNQGFRELRRVFYATEIILSDAPWTIEPRINVRVAVLTCLRAALQC